MPNDDFIVICPYYYKTIGNDVFCQGISGDDGISVEKCLFKQSFTDRKSRNNCMQRYCTSFKYSDCRLAAINNKLYGVKKNKI